MKRVFILFLSLLIYSGCKKTEEGVSLPEATHTGANTFGCLIDGKPYSVTGKSYLGHETGVIFLAYANTAWYCNGTLGYQNVTIKFDYNKNPSVPGTFELADNYPAKAEYINPTDGSLITGGNYFKTDSVHKGRITLTYYNGNIAAGTFYFDCVNDAGKIIHITDGRFDITL